MLKSAKKESARKNRPDSKKRRKKLPRQLPKVPTKRSLRKTTFQTLPQTNICRPKIKKQTPRAAQVRKPRTESWALELLARDKTPKTPPRRVPPNNELS